MITITDIVAVTFAVFNAFLLGSCTSLLSLLLCLLVFLIVYKLAYIYFEQLLIVNPTKKRQIFYIQARDSQNDDELRDQLRSSSPTHMAPAVSKGWMNLNGPIISSRSPSTSPLPQTEASGTLSQSITHSKQDQPNSPNLDHDKLNRSYRKQSIPDCCKNFNSSCAKPNCSCAKCQELYINPWKDLKLDEKVDDALQEFLDTIINDYIQSWFVCQTKHDKNFIHEIKLAILYVIANVIRRFQSIKSVEILIDSIGPILTSHLDIFLKAKSDSSSNDETIVQRYMKHARMHEALASRRKEIDWIRSIVTECLPCLLPPRYLTCKLVRTLLRELFTSGIILPALDFASEPDSLYLMLNYLLEPSENVPYEVFLYPIPGFEWLNPHKRNKKQCDSDQDNRVQLLRNFIKEYPPEDDATDFDLDYSDKNKFVFSEGKDSHETNNDINERYTDPSLIGVEERLIKDLSAWSATISRVECRLDQVTGRKYFCFLINVHRLVEMPKPPPPPPQLSASSRLNEEQLHQSSPPLSLQQTTMVQKWQIERRYNEFYALESRLREFHGDLLSDIILPIRRTFIRKTHDYMRSRQMDFERFLQCLLAMPSLRRSELVRSFLSNPSFRFNESILPDINLGKMIKTVPSKLSQERGQHLEGFLQRFIASTEIPDGADNDEFYDHQVDEGSGSSIASILRQTSTDDVDEDDIEGDQDGKEEEEHNNQRPFVNSSELTTQSPHYICHYLYDCLIYLLLRVYKLNNWLTNVLIVFQFLMRRCLQHYCKALLLLRLTTPHCSNDATNNFKNGSSPSVVTGKPVAAVIIHALMNALFPNRKQELMPKQQQHPEVRPNNDVGKVATGSYVSSYDSSSKTISLAKDDDRATYNNDSGASCDSISNISGVSSDISDEIDNINFDNRHHTTHQHHGRTSACYSPSLEQNDCRHHSYYTSDTTNDQNQQQTDQLSLTNNNTGARDGHNDADNNDKVKLTEQHQLALQRLIDVLPNWLIQQFLGGHDNHEMVCKLLLSLLEHSQLNKQIIFLLLNVYLRELFPDLILN